MKPPFQNLISVFLFLLFIPNSVLTAESFPCQKNLSESLITRCHNHSDSTFKIISTLNTPNRKTKSISCAFVPRDPSHFIPNKNGIYSGKIVYQYEATSLDDKTDFYIIELDTDGTNDCAIDKIQRTSGVIFFK